MQAVEASPGSPASQLPAVSHAPAPALKVVVQVVVNVVVAVEELFAAFVSDCSDVTLAVLLNDPNEVVVMTRLTVAVAPLLNEPRLQDTTARPVQDP